MWKKTIPIFLAVAFLLLANGILATALPLRLRLFGFSAEAIAVLGTANYAGALIGALIAPSIIQRIGCKRSFVSFVALFAMGSSAFLLPSSLLFYGVARLGIGTALSGLYLLIESRLNGIAAAGSRKHILSTYMIVFYIAQALGSYMGGFDPGGFLTISVTIFAIFLACTGIRGFYPVQKNVGASKKTALATLLGRSPEGYAFGFTAGILLGSFYGLGALFAQATLSNQTLTGPFMAIAMLGGVCGLGTFGTIARHWDERACAIAASLVASITAFTLIFPIMRDDAAYLVMVGLFGTAAFSIYPFASACVNSDVPDAMRVDANGLFIFIAAAGGVTGPILTGLLMGFIGPKAVFLVIAAATITAAAFGAVHRKARPISIHPLHNAG
jgi:MFS family permease